MIIPIQPQSVTASRPGFAVAQRSAFEGPGRDAQFVDPHRPPAALCTPRGSTRDHPAPSIRIGRLIVENAPSISAAALRESFREAWLRHEPTPRVWTSDAFRRELTIDLPSGVTGRELGRKLAEAILRRTSIHP